MLDVLARDEPTTCCAPLSQTTITESDAEMVAAKFKALADPARVRILSIVAAHEDKEACVCDLQEPLGLSQPTVSHHLKILMKAGFLTRSQRGSWAYYSLVPGSLKVVADVLHESA